MRNNQAFTLMEVLVALVILSVMAAGYLSYTGSQAQRTGYLFDKTIASIIATNAIAEIQTSGQFPAAGKSDQDVVMANRHWQVVMDVQKTASVDLQRLEVSVALQSQTPTSPLVTLTGFAGRH